MVARLTFADRAPVPTIIAGRLDSDRRETASLIA